MMDRLKQAKLYARAAHAAVGQKRKYTNEPYHVHTEEVAAMVWYFTQDVEVTMAAYLHDVLEDTQVTSQDLEREFGIVVPCLVEMVTDVSKPSDGNRATRKEIDLAHLEKASPEAQTIKLADLISNTKDIVKHDKDFAKVYLVEKEKALQVLTKGNAQLYELACNTLADAKKALEIA